MFDALALVSSLGKNKFHVLIISLTHKYILIWVREIVYILISLIRDTLSSSK